MENSQADIQAQRSKTKKVVWFSLGTLAVGVLAFFGINHFKKQKEENDDDTKPDQAADTAAFEKTFQTPAHHKPAASLPAAGNSSAFPLRLGSKGDKVRLLQNALIRTYGASVLAKYGTDGQFGKELQSALTTRGYAVPLQEEDFLKITADKADPASTQPAPPPLASFDPKAIAGAIYSALSIHDFDTSITLLKSIKDTTDYSLVSEELKNYRIGGVRKTLVTAMLSTFTQSSQKTKIQTAFKAIGLKYDGKKWTL